MSVDSNDPSFSSDSPSRVRLSESDASLLDRLVDVGFDRQLLAGELSPTELERVDRLLATLAPLDAYPIPDLDADDADVLVSATMARIDRADDERAARMRVDADSSELTGRRRGFRRSDLVAAACVAILATCVIVPTVHFSNTYALNTQCSNNLRLVANGLESYAKDFGATPMRASLLPSLGNWADYKHGDNLRMLDSLHYCGPDCMCCTGNAAATYASQVPTAARKPLPNAGPRVAMVADANPLVELVRDGKTIDRVPLNSKAHGTGQNVLFTDGSIEFLTRPYIDGPDNIWLPFGDQANSLFQPTGTDIDVFLLQ